MSHVDMLQLFDIELRPYRSNDSVCSGRALIAPAKAAAGHQVICFAIGKKAARG